MKKVLVNMHKQTCTNSKHSYTSVPLRRRELMYAINWTRD